MIERPTPKAKPLLAKVRELCMGLPEVVEKQSHGEAAWFVKKQFATFMDHHHDDRIGIWCAAPPGAQAEWIERDPVHYFRPPYVGGRGWLGVHLDAPGVDWDEIADIVEEAYRTVAPAKLVARLDAGG